MKFKMVMFDLSFTNTILQDCFMFLKQCQWGKRQFGVSNARQRKLTDWEKDFFRIYYYSTMNALQVLAVLLHPCTFLKRWWFIDCEWSIC